MEELKGAGSASPGSTRSSLLRRVQSDDRAAWQQLVDLYGPLVSHWCRRSGLAHEDWADVFQDVFLAVATHIQTFRKEKPGDTFRGWLWTIARNKIRDRLRRQKRQPPGVGGSDAKEQLEQFPDPLNDLDDSADSDQDSGLVRRALELIRGDFEERTWRAFWLVVVEGGSPADVAEALGMPRPSVYQARSRVLRRLREVLGDLIQ